MTLPMWPDPHVDLLRKLWGEGLSASQISFGLFKAFPDAGYSRSAVIGKVHRLGLTGTGLYGRHAASPLGDRRTYNVAPKPLKAPAVARAKEQRPEHHEEAQLRLSGRDRPQRPKPPRSFTIKGDADAGTAPLLTLGPHMCKWPIGDPQKDGFSFCGRRRGEGPYCAEHHKRAYASEKTRKWVDARLFAPPRGHQRFGT